MKYLFMNGHVGRTGATLVMVCRRACSLAVEQINPGWFASVMGTGILALCAALLPVKLPVLHGLSIALWLSGVLLLIGLLSFWLAQSLRNPRQVRASLAQVASAQGWGAPPIACFTIATGFLVIGPQILRLAWCISIAEALWLAGAIGGIFTIVAIPYLTITRFQASSETTYGSWLLPIAPAVISSVPGGLLIPHLPHAMQSSMLVICYSLWGMGMVLTLIITVLFYSRLMYHHLPASALVPTTWIVLGPFGVSVAGLLALCRAALPVWPTLAAALRAASTFYSLTVWGFAIYWLGLALLVTLHAARGHLPFSLSWWSFTFPVGVLATGTFALYTRTQASIFVLVGVILCLLLAAMWLLVGVKTLRVLVQNLEQARLVHVKVTAK